MGTLDDVWKNVKFGVLGIGTLFLMGNFAVAQELKKINVTDLPPIRPEWPSIVYFAGKDAIKIYDTNGDGEPNFRVIYSVLPIPPEVGVPGFSYGPPTIFGCDIDGKNGIGFYEMFEIDYSNFQPKLNMDC